MNKNQARQGDVFVEKISALPTGTTKVETKIVAEGEGHHEHVVNENVDIVMKDGVMYLVVNEDTTMDHVTKGTTTQAEHNPVSLEKGYYQVTIQREYDPYEDVIRQTRD